MTKKHKEFIKQIKSMPRCTVTPEDIYEKTDFFDRQPSPRRSNPFKLAFLVCVALVFVTLTSTIILGVQNHQLKNQEPQSFKSITMSLLSMIRMVCRKR